MATIIIDFDDTIFDTKNLKKSIFNKLSENNINKDIIKITYEECRNQYSLSKHVKILKKKDIIVPKSIKGWLNHVDLTSHIFPNTISDLEKLSKNNYLILLTNGDFKFQNIKITGSGVSKYFDEIHITKEPKHEFMLNKKYKYPVYFINDKKTENTQIKKYFPNMIIKEKKRGSSIGSSLSDVLNY